MLGLNEILLTLAIVALIAIFGKKAILKTVRDFFEVKKDIEKIKNEGNLSNK